MSPTSFPDRSLACICHSSTNQTMSKFCAFICSVSTQLIQPSRYMHANEKILRSKESSRRILWVMVNVIIEARARGSKLKCPSKHLCSEPTVRILLVELIYTKLHRVWGTEDQPNSCRVSSSLETPSRNILLIPFACKFLTQAFSNPFKIASPCDAGREDG